MQAEIGTHPSDGPGLCFTSETQEEWRAWLDAEPRGGDGRLARNIRAKKATGKPFVAYADDGHDEARCVSAGWTPDPTKLDEAVPGAV